jgi:hypothetical protein
MRERITFVHRRGDGVDPAALELQHAQLNGPQIQAVREDRLTMALDELGPELVEVLQDYEEVHLRWSSSSPYETVEPFASRLPPGLHLTYTLVRPLSHDPSVVLPSWFLCPTCKLR